MIQKAVVKRLLDDNNVEIEVQRQSACSGDCNKCGGCATPTEFVQAIAQNPVGACVGEIVTVEGSSKVIMQFAAIVYMLPLVLFFVGYGICAGLALATWLCTLAGVAGFLIGIAHAMWHNHREKKNGGFVFEIIKRG